MLVPEKPAMAQFVQKKRPGKDPARLKVTTKSKPAYENLYN